MEDRERGPVSPTHAITQTVQSIVSVITLATLGKQIIISACCAMKSTRKMHSVQIFARRMFSIMSGAGDDNGFVRV